MPLELSDIVDTSYLQAMLEIFSKDMQSTGINIASAILNEEARPIVYETNFVNFCNKIRETTAGERQCWLSDLKSIDSAKQYFKKGTPKTVFHICNLGLLDFCAPIFIGKEIIGYFFGGQIRVKNGFKYEKKSLKTLNSPNLVNLSRDINSNTIGCSVKEYINALKKEFADVKVLKTADHNRLKQAIDAMARQINSIVRELYESQHVNLFDTFMEEVKDVQNIDGLFELVVNKLPVIMNSKYCSIFTVQKGYPENEDCLVLRKTNYKNINKVPDENRLEENSSHYKENEKNTQLTPWVWANAKSLLLKDITNSDELGSYNITRSAGKYNDSDEHKGFLAVPIIGYKRQVIGVIRMPHKIKGEGRNIDYTNHDAIFLKFLAHHLAPVIERQELLDQYERTEGLVNAAHELARASSSKKVLDLILQHITMLFGGGGGKRYFVNRYRPGSLYWTVKKTEGDLGLDVEWENPKYLINRSLTGRVIQDGQPILLHNLNTMGDTEDYIESVTGVKSAMFAPLKHSDKIYGAIGIVSNKKFIFSEKDLEILKIIAEMGGDAIVRTRWFFLKELLKKILDWIPFLKHLL